jgi:hypothetical protein
VVCSADSEHAVEFSRNFCRVNAQLFTTAEPQGSRKEKLSMTRTRRFTQFAAVTMAASTLFFATAAFAGDPAKAVKASSAKQTINTSDQILLDDVLGGGRCAVAAPSPTPQGVQVIHVCNNWTGAAGAHVQLFNTTGTNCTVSASTTTWPFVQSSPLSIADGNGVFVTLLSTLQSGTAYYYAVSCCPQNGMKTVTVP